MHNTFTFHRDCVSTLWFIGLVFKKTENLNIDLTQDIQAFTAQGKTGFQYHSWLWVEPYFISPPTSCHCKNDQGRPAYWCETRQKERLEQVFTASFITANQASGNQTKTALIFSRWTNFLSFDRDCRAQCRRAVLRMAIQPIAVQPGVLYCRGRDHPTRPSTPRWWRNSERKRTPTALGTWRLDHQPSPSWCRAICHRFRRPIRLAIRFQFQPEILHQTFFFFCDSHPGRRLQESLCYSRKRRLVLFFLGWRRPELFHPPANQWRRSFGRRYR